MIVNFLIIDYEYFFSLKNYILNILFKKSRNHNYHGFKEYD